MKIIKKMNSEILKQRSVTGNYEVNPDSYNKYRYEKFKLMVYNHSKYILLFSTEKLLIFTGELLDTI